MIIPGPQRIARDYISVSMSADQASPAVGTALAFNTTDEIAGLDLALASSQISGLKSGRTYLILVDVSVTLSAAGRVQWELYDVTAAAQLQQRSMATPTRVIDAVTPYSMAFIFKPSQDTTISVRHLGTSGASPTYIGVDATDADKSRMQVLEIG